MRDRSTANHSNPFFNSNSPCPLLPLAGGLRQMKEVKKKQDPRLTTPRRLSLPSAHQQFLWPIRYARCAPTDEIIAFALTMVVIAVILFLALQIGVKSISSLSRVAGSRCPLSPWENSGVKTHYVCADSFFRLEFNSFKWSENKS